MPARAHTRLAWCAALAIGAIGCGRLGFESDQSRWDAGEPLDAGDAGEPLDAGEPVDAGEPLDASEPVDAGELLDAPMSPDASACMPVTLTSQRSYAPPTTEPANVTFDIPGDVVVPAEFPVEAGNAGNHWLRVELDLASGASEVCCYQGTAAVSDPMTPFELERGREYVFSRCLDDTTLFCEMPAIGTPNARLPGDVVRVGGVRLAVLNGGASAGTTVVRWTIPCP